MLKRLFAGVAVAGMVAAPAFAGQLEDAHEAYHSGDYATAQKLFTPLAEEGNPDAQRLLGSIYYYAEDGRGAAQDFAEAAKWWRRAANQGITVAQSNLGYMYAHGQGVPQDYVQAYLWFSVAAARGDADAADDRDGIAHQMTPDQIAEAQRLAREWKAKPE
jgi:uncharacterized protein